jgi:membrane-bound inhibitor of C-type lysozyme
MHLKSCAVVILSVISASPALAAQPSHQVIHARYVCEDGTRFLVRFVDQTAVVTLADGTKVTLPQQLSGSGFWYSSGRFELRGKGRDATWTVGRKMPVNCSAVE